MSLGVIDVEGDEVLSFDAGAALVVHPHVFPFKAQLEELTLGDGHLHLSVLTVHLRLDDVVITCRARTDAEHVTGRDVMDKNLRLRKQLKASLAVLVGNSGQPHRSPPFSSSQVKFVQISPAQGS